jgi:DUF4097 and DUF4098 domain-containing protein YvlB
MSLFVEDPAPTVALPPEPPRPSVGARIAVGLGVLIALYCVAWGVLVVLDMLTHQHATTTRALPAAPARIVVSVDGSVRIDAAAAGAPATVQVRRRWSWRNPHYTETVQGDTLRISSSCFSLGPLPCSTDLRISVPASTALEVHAKGGGVRVTGMRAPAVLTSSAGAVTATDVTAPTLTMHSSAGAVRGVNLSVPVVDARSSAGSVRLDLAVEPSRVVADSSAGSVTTQVPRGRTAYRIDARTSAGRRTVEVPTDPGSPRSIRAHSSAGSVTVGYR